jgi:hypothetical protein
LDTPKIDDISLRLPRVTPKILKEIIVLYRGRVTSSFYRRGRRRGSKMGKGGEIKEKSKTRGSDLIRVLPSLAEGEAQYRGMIWTAKKLLRIWPTACPGRGCLAARY